MLRRCLFCRRSFAETGEFQHAPTSKRIAYDPVEGRLWAICSRCHKWTLWPVEERDAALYELERAAYDHGVAVARTANVSLIAVGSVLLVRVGAADLAEQSWWRYGRELERRRRVFEGAASRITAYTFGALHLVGELVGLGDQDVDITWDDAPVADILRWRRFGWAAWHGRETCRFCGSTLRALRYDMTWWVYPLRGADGSLHVGVPCQRCDPWTPENLYVIDGPHAEMVLQRCLAYQNIAGAGERAVREAAGVIMDAGSVGEFSVEAVERQECLWKLGRTRGLALEIALNETVERRLLDMEARSLEFVWRREEELARIIDRELTPRRLLESHLRRLPIRLGRRSEGPARPSAPGVGPTL